jgi:hypothetical protein
MTSRAAVGVECILPVMLTQARRFRCAVFRLTLICDAFCVYYPVHNLRLQSPCFPYRPSTLPEDNGGLLHPVINMAVPVKFFIEDNSQIPNLIFQLQIRSKYYSLLETHQLPVVGEKNYRVCSKFMAVNQ